MLAETLRQQHLPAGDNLCGASRHTPSLPNGWCAVDSTSHQLEATSVDTSAMYMASGLITSDDGTEVYLFASAQPFTHGGMKKPHTWGRNTGIQLLKLRRDGFVAVEAGYGAWALKPPTLQAPTLTTVAMHVPTCAPTV